LLTLKEKRIYIDSDVSWGHTSRRPSRVFIFTVLNKKLSCRREAAQYVVFVYSQLQHTYSAVFYY